MSTIFHILLALASSALAVNANLSGAADAVLPASSTLSVAGAGCGESDCLVQIVRQAFTWIKDIFTVLATFVIVRYGVALVYSQEEEKLQKAKKMLGASIAALMLLYLAGPLTDAFYGGYSSGYAGKALAVPTVSAGILTREVVGVVAWFETIVAVLAVTIIIVSGILAVVSYGKEEGGAQFKRSIFAVIFGVFLIAIKQLILGTFGLQIGGPPTGTTSVTFALQKIVQIVSRLLEFTALLAAAVIVYAGILMILNFGNEDQYTKAKGILVRTCIGLLAVGMSYAVIQLVMTMA